MSNKGTALILYLLLVILLLAGIFVGTKIIREKRFQAIIKPTEYLSETNNFNLPDCENQRLFFSALPVELDKISYISPLGNVSPTSHVFPTDHIYFNRSLETDKNNMPLNFNEDGVDINVYSPGRVYVTRIVKLDRSLNEQDTEQSEQGAESDYAVYFSPCKEFGAYFSHLATLSEKLFASYTALAEEDETAQECNTYTTGDKNYTQCEVRPTDYPQLEAGELIGTVAHKNNTTSFDMGAFDMRTPELKFANPGRWHDLKKHTVCPLDYFVPEIKEQLYTFVGDTGTQKRSVLPVCGELAQDVLNTAQGIWFVEGTSTTNTYPEDPHLALVHDNVDPALGVFSIGTSTVNSGIKNGRYYFSPRNTRFVNRDFADIKVDNNIYCYEGLVSQKNTTETVELSIIVQLINNTTLKIEGKEPGYCHGVQGGVWEFSNPSVFVR